MKILKRREKSVYLRAYEALDKRMMLSEDDKFHLWNMQKGFKGEMGLDRTAEEQLVTDALVLDDLLFTEKGSTFQVDKVILTGEAFQLMEVKNFEGDFQFNSRSFLTSAGKDIGNPLTKLEETARRMRQLMSKWNIQLPLKASLVFVNPAFTLYNAPMNSPIVFPTQIETYFSKMNTCGSPLTSRHHYAAEKLLRAHQKESAFQRKLPAYSYASLDKGLWCLHCGSTRLSLTQRRCTCEACGRQTSVDAAVVFHIEELRLLFPDLKVTSAVVYHWIGKLITVRRIQKILAKYFHRRGATSDSYYE